MFVILSKTPNGQITFVDTNSRQVNWTDATIFKSHEDAKNIADSDKAAKVIELSCIGSVPLSLIYEDK